jgi:DNA processing protein
MLKGREIIVYLSIKYQGNWNQIYRAIKEKELVNEDDVIAKVASLHCQTVTIVDDAYPESLKKIYKPPFVLFYQGHIEWLMTPDRLLAVVGTRQPSVYGQEMAAKMTKQLVDEGIGIVSGLAKGIDTIAHQSAVQHGGKTIAVLGNGLDVCYPPDNRDLLEIIKRDHLVLSEYPPAVKPNQEHFPWRNRIIAALAQALFVVEAKKRSGTLITVGYALYLGKDVFVLPHHANSDNSTNRLIKDGAILVENGEDILEYLIKKNPSHSTKMVDEPQSKKMM